MEQINDFPDAKFKKFITRREAEEFIKTEQNSHRNEPSCSSRVTPNISSDVCVKIEGNDCSSTINSNAVSQKGLEGKSTFKSDKYLSGVTVTKEPSTAPMESDEVIPLEMSQWNYTAPPCLKESVYYPNFKSYEFLRKKKEKKYFVCLTETELCDLLKEKFVEDKSNLLSKDNGELPVESESVGCNDNSYSDCKVQKKKSKDKKRSVSESKEENNNLSAECVSVENKDSSNSEIPKKKKKKSKEKEMIELETEKKKKKHNSNPSVESEKVGNDEESDSEVPKKKKKKSKDKETIELETKEKKKKHNSDVIVECIIVDDIKESVDSEVPKKKKKKKSREEEIIELETEDKKKKHNSDHIVEHISVENIEESVDSKVSKKKKKKSREKEIIGLETSKKKKDKLMKSNQIEDESGEQGPTSKEIRQYDQKKETESGKEIEEASPGLKQIDQILLQAMNNHFDLKALVQTAIENLLTNGVLLPQMLQKDFLTQIQQHNMTQERATQPGPSTSGLNNSVCWSVSNNLKNEKTLNKNDSINLNQCRDLKIFDVTTQNLRLDSLETRFDDCLKQIGGICSEMCHLRGEINKSKERLTEQSARLSKLNDHTGRVGTGVRSFNHEPMTEQSTLNEALKPTQSVQLEPLPGTSRSFSSLQHDCPPVDTCRRKRIKLELDKNPAQPQSQGSRTKKVDSNLEDIYRGEEWLKHEPEDPDPHLMSI